MFDSSTDGSLLTKQQNLQKNKLLPFSLFYSILLDIGCCET